ncbi:MAG: M14 family zinc carboxypeptidase, partial [Candidatus Krumholzibacteriia bacterium]
MPTLRRLFATALFLVCGSAAATAAPAGLNQGVPPLPLDRLLPGTDFAPGLPTLPEITGVEPLARPLRPEEVLAWFTALDAASPRARLVEFARTHEGRPLVYLAVSDEATIADLDGFRTRHRDRLDPRTAAAPATGDKPVAWMAYGIHGDELSSTDAAALLAWWLVAGQDERARNLRDGLLILIDPCENPDGRARYLAQTTAFAHRTANPDQDDLSHRAVWPWGRGNHYLFDMNRDWFTMVHPESRRSAEIAAWLPQLVVDSHEMGANSTYLFPPARHPFNPLLPQNAEKWALPFSMDQAGALDARGYPYFSGEWNEEFFPGYGSSWARYLGSVGILYEMSRTTGTMVRKRSGALRTFGEAVDHQLTSSIANLETLQDHAGEVLADHAAALAAIVAAGGKGEVRAWVLPPDPRHPDIVPDLARLLTDQGIEVQELAAAAEAGDLVDARTGERGKRALPAGTLLVRLDQPSGALARALLDPHVPMETVFLQDEREYLEKGKGSRLYETTAWSLVLARGVPALWSARIPGGQWRPWAPAPAAAAAWTPPAAWTSVVWDGDQAAAQAALADLLQRGVTVRVAAKPIVLAGRSFRPGACVVSREGNADGTGSVLAEVAARHGLRPVAVTTSRPEDGPDLGGGEFGVLVAPRVGVLTGMPVAPDDYGFVWHLLDQELDLRFSALDVGSFGRIDLSRYNVLVFPPIWGGPAGYRQLLGPGGVETLRSWVQAGGTAIGIGAGARLLADPETELTSVRFRGQALDDYPPAVWSIGAAEAQAAGRPTATGLRVAATGGGEDGKESGGEFSAPTRDASPYDVAPVLGPGARPFAGGHDQGTPLAGPPVPLDRWLQEVLPPGRKAPEEGDRQRADARLRGFMPQGALLRTE